MVLEERASKEFAEFNHRSESLFFKPEIINFPPRKLEDLNINQYYLNLNDLGTNNNQGMISKTAYRLWEGLLHGHLKPSAVFEPKQTGAYLAMIDFWGLQHALHDANLRYYFNPITLKFEPVPYDIEFDVSNRKLGKLYSFFNHLSKLQHSDHKIHKHYLDTLRKLDNMLANENLNASLRKIDIVNRKALGSYMPLLTPIDLSNNSKAIRCLLRENNHKKCTSPTVQHMKTKRNSNKINPLKEWLDQKSILSFLHLKDSKKFFEIINPHNSPVLIEDIIGITTENKKKKFTFSSHVNYPLALTANNNSIKNRKIFYFENDELNNIKSIEIKVRKPNSSDVLTYNPLLRLHPYLRSPIPNNDVKKTLKHHTFMKLVDQNKKLLLIPPGEWKISNDLIVPEGYQLNISAGATLSFAPGNSIISHGTLNMLGTKEKPIFLQGIAKGKNKLGWKGVVVLGPTAPSHWSYVTIKDTTGIKYNGWELRGGVTFYKNNIVLEHCNFIGNRSEDALNIIHSKFILKNTNILHALSDGFDADFSEGSIIGGTFAHIGSVSGGDAIDVSGSKVIINHTNIQHIRDKALSVGERSHVTANHLMITHSGSGAVSKDGSKLIINNSKIQNITHYALMAYIKKSEFGPGKIIVNNTTIERVNKKAIAQKGSEIQIDSQPIETVELDVKQLYLTFMKSEKPL